MSRLAEKFKKILMNMKLTLEKTTLTFTLKVGWLGWLIKVKQSSLILWSFLLMIAGLELAMLIMKLSSKFKQDLLKAISSESKFKLIKI